MIDKNDNVEIVDENKEVEIEVKKKTPSTKSNTSKPEEVTKSAEKRQKELNDNVLIKTKSNTYGKLTYINPRTGDITIWEGYGDIQDMTIADLRAMRGSNVEFFASCLIYLMSAVGEEYSDWESKDLYQSLNVIRYYQDIFDIKNIEEVFNWTIEEMNTRIPQMPQGLKMTLMVGANSLIRDGRLDSIKKITTLEKLLNCELGLEED